MRTGAVGGGALLPRDAAFGERCAGGGRKSREKTSQPMHQSGLDPKGPFERDANIKQTQVPGMRLCGRERGRERKRNTG